MLIFLFFFFFNDTATTEIYTLSLHDALPILSRRPPSLCLGRATPPRRRPGEREPSHKPSGYIPNRELHERARPRREPRWPEWQVPWEIPPILPYRTRQLRRRLAGLRSPRR